MIAALREHAILRDRANLGLGYELLRAGDAEQALIAAAIARAIEQAGKTR